MKNEGTTESSPPMTSCSQCGALRFDVNLCRNRRQHEENDIIWGSLYSGSRVLFFGALPSSDRWTGNHPDCQVSLFTEKNKSSPFSPVHPESPCTYSCILFSTVSHQFLYPLRFHLESTVLYIYYDYTRFFFTVNVFCAAPQPVW